MISGSKRAILLAATTVLWGRVAAADGDGRTDPAPPPPAAGSSAPVPVADSTANAAASPPLSDADLAAESEALAETITIYDERPTKPFDRDTEVRLTGEQLAARGATDLATALALLPDVTVRDAGRGGFNIDIRGGRKGEVSILIDGVNVTDPYYGTYDLSSIPITDIVQIRIATTPQSPIDGPGGPGGVIEVHTRDAFGPQIVIARLTGDSLPSAGVSATARAPLTDKLALRISYAGLDSGRTLTLKAPFNNIDESYRDASGSVRLEYRDGKERIALDGFVDGRHYVNPPNETQSVFLLVDRETTARSSIKYDNQFGDTQVQASASEFYLVRHSINFQDPTLAKQLTLEDLNAWRTGGQVLATRPITRELRWAASVTLNRDQVAVGQLAGPTTRGDTTVLEAAVDLQYEHRTVRLDGSVGVADPFGIDASAWPEAKLDAHWRPYFGSLELIGTVGHKGRVPALRERFEPGDGDPSLGPELDTYGELRAIEHLTDRVHIEVAPFYRHQTGTIRTSPSQDSTDPEYGKLINLGIVNLKGIDVLGRVKVHRMLEVGGGYSYIYAFSDTTGPDPLDRLPHNRFDAWAQASPLPNLSGLVRAVFFGESLNQGQLLSNYLTWEASATWQINRKYMVVLKGTDLTDVRPETRPGVFGPGRTGFLIFQGTWE